MDAKAIPPAIEVFESRIKDSGFFIESRSSLVDEAGEPHYWFYQVSRKQGERFPVVAVISFQYENESEFGERAAKDVIETLERRVR